MPPNNVFFNDFIFIFSKTIYPLHIKPINIKRKICQPIIRTAYTFQLLKTCCGDTEIAWEGEGPSLADGVLVPHKSPTTIAGSEASAQSRAALSNPRWGAKCLQMNAIHTHICTVQRDSSCFLNVKKEKRFCSSALSLPHS